MRLSAWVKLIGPGPSLAASQASALKPLSAAVTESALCSECFTCAVDCLTLYTISAVFLRCICRSILDIMCLSFELDKHVLTVSGALTSCFFTVYPSRFVLFCFFLFLTKNFFQKRKFMKGLHTVSVQKPVFCSLNTHNPI